MKLLRTVVLFLFLTLPFCACETDDICVDGNTPLLVLGFYDFDDREVVKEVPSLVIRGDNGTGTALEALQLVVNDSNAVSVPLRPNIASTQFILSQNQTPTDTTTVNNDRITFSYDTLEEFKSRACGFVANYDNVVAELAVEPDSLLWIRGIEIIAPLIENSNETHVKIYH